MPEQKVKIKMPDKLQGNVLDVEGDIERLCLHTPCKISCEECAFNSMESFNTFLSQVGLNTPKGDES